MRLTTSHDRRVGQTTRSAPGLAVALTVGALGLVFGLDRSTGSAPVQHLYYVPIILAAVAFGVRGGVLGSLAAILLYHAANPHLLTFRYEEADLVQIVLFVSVGVVTAKLALDATRLRQLAMTDDLTGLHNLRSFEQRLAMMVHASRQERLPLAVVVLDVDRLKALNDQYGHLAGAEAVRAVGHIIGGRLPPDAVACRYGGDEFAVSIPRCSVTRVRAFADDVCRTVHEAAPTLAGRGFPVGTLSVSAGACCAHLDTAAAALAWSPIDAETGEAMFRAADAALYRAKASGRNRVSVAGERVFAAGVQ
jgi:diguanylate cyclase (GGDEF)-like protein